MSNDPHTCPRCDRPLARSDGRAPQCRYCGWSAVRPVPRRPETSTRSRGAIATLARGVSSLIATLLRLALIVAVLSVVAVPFGGTGISVLDNTAGEAHDALEDLRSSAADAQSPIDAGREGAERDESAGDVATRTATPNADTDASTSDTNATFDRAATGRYVHQYINEERTERGLEPLDFDEDLREVARYYSARMAREDFFSHTAPDGGTLADRYDRFGYDCRVSIDEGRVATGGENLAYTYYGAPVRTDDGIEYYDSERDLARGIVDGWMNSAGHRKNLLRSYWEHQGIGVYAIEDEGRFRVYVTQHLC